MPTFRSQFTNRISTRWPDLARIIESLHLFPFSWRKVLLSFSQTGDVDFVSAGIREQCQLYPIVIESYSRHPLTLNILKLPLADISKSIVSRSILSMFLRTTIDRSAWPQEEQIRNETFTKEFRASQVAFSDHAEFDWSPLYTDVIPRNYFSPDWFYLCRRTITSFRNKIKRLGVLYPAVSRKKNVGEETSEWYRLFEDRDYVRTVDLEVLYSRTGIKVGGPCEMRSAWRFNDLKPRFYYTKGGHAHWNSRYMKPFAVALLESLITTNQVRRTNPFDYLPANDSYFIVYWDYSAFTTSLSELKFYMEAISKGLRDEVYDVRLFDYRDGIVHCDPSDLLDTYNESINCHDTFSVHRLSEAMDIGLEPSSNKVQMNNGMLGVEGNIGFSMSCHGIVIAGEVDEHGVCVGDDGLAMIHDDPTLTLIPSLRALGSIHDEKFGIIRPQNSDTGKFLKRGFHREDNTILTTILLDFPLSAFIDENYIGRTIPIGMDDGQRLNRVAIACGQLLWQVHLEGSHIDGRDLSLIREFLILTYQRCGFPVNGSLIPFTPSNNPTARVTRAVPSLRFSRFDPRMGDWLEFLMDEHVGPITIPWYMYIAQQPRKPDPGYSIYADSVNPGFKALEDMGYCRIELLNETIWELTEMSRRKIRKMFGRIKDYQSRRICRLHCLKFIPSQYDFLFSDDPSMVDYMEISQEI